MRRLLIASLVLPAFVAGSAVAAHGKNAAAPAKVTICHKTGSDSNEFRRITVSSRAVQSANSKSGKVLRAHLRHKGDAIVVGTGACPPASLTPEPSSTPPAKIEICHKTHSKKNPHRRIMVSSRAVTKPNSAAGKMLRGHMRHPGEIIMPGATACPSAQGTEQQGAVALTADLQPLPQAGGSGSATVTIRLGKSQLCYTLTVSNLGSTVTAAHIHNGMTTGIVVPLAPPTSGSSSGCLTVDKTLLREILKNPGGFYINVHTQEWADGQIRGDLKRA